ncbi:hypothetical protein F4802DRAFT_593315 [Xylaria palmicola]|nr:hypothetical protein F4802DRAFT_593315 [Xylaria palmicola]
MLTDVESIERLGTAVLADIKSTVARRLVDEHLHHFVRSRDELLRLERPDDSETIRLLRHQILHGLEQAWNNVLQRLRSGLPDALDQLFNSLQLQFHVAENARDGPRSTRSLSPPPTSTELPSVTNYTFEPVLSDLSDIFETASPPNTRARSITLAPNVTAAEDDEGPSATVGMEGPVVCSAGKVSNKRAVDRDEPVVVSPPKRTRRTPQTSIHKPPGHRVAIKRRLSLRDVLSGECVFSYGGYPEVYVLRCSQLKCKRRLKRDGPTIFTSHPFRDGLALGHFDGKGHNMDSEAEIFRKFAIQVIDTDIERNTEKKAATHTPPESDLSGPEDGGEDVTLRPTSTKGKKPERPYDLYQPYTRTVEASTSTPASSKKETFRDSFYRAGPLSDSGLLSDVDVEGSVQRRRGITGHVLGTDNNKLPDSLYNLEIMIPNFGSQLS